MLLSLMVIEQLLKLWACGFVYFKKVLHILDAGKGVAAVVLCEQAQIQHKTYDEILKHNINICCLVACLLVLCSCHCCITDTGNYVEGRGP
jgi:hypothetical protein